MVGVWEGLNLGSIPNFFLCFGMHPKIIDIYPKLIPKGGVVQFCRHRWQSAIGHIWQFVAPVIFSVTDFCIQGSQIQEFLQKSGTAAPALQHTRLTKHILIFVRKSWNIYWSNHASWIEITHHFSKFLNSFHSWHLDGQTLSWVGCMVGSSQKENRLDLPNPAPALASIPYNNRTRLISDKIKTKQTKTIWQNWWILTTVKQNWK